MPPPPPPPPSDAPPDDTPRNLTQTQLIKAVEALHAEATRRGLLLQPTELLARRGISSVCMSTMPSVCSKCEQGGQWSDEVIPNGLLCCHLCLTVVHRRCTHMSEATIKEHGWECDDCWDPLRFGETPPPPKPPLPTPCATQLQTDAKVRDEEAALLLGWRDHETKINANRGRVRGVSGYQQQPHARAHVCTHARTHTRTTHPIPGRTCKVHVCARWKLTPVQLTNVRLSSRQIGQDQEAVLCLEALTLFPP